MAGEEEAGGGGGCNRGGEVERHRKWWRGREGVKAGGRVTSGARMDGRERWKMEGGRNEGDKRGAGP